MVLFLAGRVHGIRGLHGIRRLALAANCCQLPPHLVFVVGERTSAEPTRRSLTSLVYVHGGGCAERMEDENFLLVTRSLGRPIMVDGNSHGPKNVQHQLFIITLSSYSVSSKRL
eukprot:7519538-Pyramimonas_sp.AAC.2